MNQLPRAKRIQIANLLVEGNSLRSTSRIADVSINTVTKLLADIGDACEKFHDQTVKHLRPRSIQFDKIWSFVYAKHSVTPESLEETAGGDVWIWTCFDADTKLIVSWLVGSYTMETADIFMTDIASRIGTGLPITTDRNYQQHRDAVENAFGNMSVDFAQLVKMYENQSEGETRYSPPEFIGTNKNIVLGNLNGEHISTNLIERQRLHMGGFTQPTNAFSKKIENHCLAIALHFFYYNFVKVHKMLRVTPAMESGLAKKPMTIEELMNL